MQSTSAEHMILTQVDGNAEQGCDGGLSLDPSSMCVALGTHAVNGPILNCLLLYTAMRL